MEKELTYRLSNPNYTVYHRAALGGLAATIRAWGTNSPEGITAAVTRDHVRLAWSDQMTDQEALRRILEASFKLTADKLIDLPGQGIKAGQDDLRLAIHNGITGTFLQHPKMRPGEKEPRRFEFKTDDEVSEIFTYKAVNNYAHQKAQGTELLEKKYKDSFPPIASVPQSVVPGAMSGALDLQAPAEDVMLLLFLMVGCAIFLLRPRTYREKAQYCVIVPDVIDLELFARDLHRITATGPGIKRFSNSYLGRVVGGAEEAALRFLIDLQAEEITSERSVAGCLVVAMGKVAWDKNQINRSVIAKLKGDYPEMGVFRAANTYLGQTRVIKSKKGEGYAIPTSPVPELVAANLAAERHWCTHFVDLVKDKKDFDRMHFVQGGLKAMNEAITDTDDQAIIRAFHEAWYLTMGALGERARRGDGVFERLAEVERERLRNAILRAKTADALAGWFLRFCADATKGGALGAFRTDGLRIRKFIFNPRNFDRFQNLCLFALVSYTRRRGENCDKRKGITMATHYLYGTILTGEAVAANNRGDNIGNTMTLQKVFHQDDLHTSVSAEAIRFALRYRFQLEGLKVNRSYDPEASKLDYKDEKRTTWNPTSGNVYLDDDLMGFMDAEAAKQEQEDEEQDTTEASEPKPARGRRKAKGTTTKRPSPLAIGRAVSLRPYRGELSYNAVSGEKTKGALSLYGTEMHTTEYQYSFGLNLSDVVSKEHIGHLLDAIFDPPPVAGNHARFAYDFSPASIVLRVTSAHSSKIQNCFEHDEEHRTYTIARLLQRIENSDIPARELIVGGEVSTTPEGAQLKGLGVAVLSGVKAAVDEARRCLAARDATFAVLVNHGG